MKRFGVGHLVLLLILYVLSVGPAVWVNDRLANDRLREVLYFVYYPVIWLYENTLLHEPMDRYVRLFQ